MSCERPLIRVYNPNDHNITGSIMTLEKYRERAHNPTATYESLAYRKDVMLLPCESVWDADSDRGKTGKQEC